MSDYKLGDHVLVKLSGGRLVQATIKAIVDTTDGVRLQVSFGYPTLWCESGSIADDTTFWAALKCGIWVKERPALSLHER